MPFTLSHPAFAMPLRRVFPKLSIGGLALGSMAPDLEYFVRMEAVGTVGHRFSGFMLIGLPICAALYCAYMYVIRHVLHLWMPAAFGLRDYVFAATRNPHKKRAADWLWLLWSVIVGYGTHLFMDAWTHGSGLFVRHFGFLWHNAGGLPLFQQLQYLFSLLGAALIAGWLLRSWLNWHHTGMANHSNSNSFGNTVDLTNNRNRSAVYGIAMYVPWLASAVLAIGALYAKLRDSAYPGRLDIWVVAPFSSAAVGLFLAAVLLIAYQSRRRVYGAVLVVSLLAVIAALMEGFVSIAANALGAALTPDQIWIGEMWIFSAAIIFLSLTVNRIVNNFVRNGLKSVKKRTLLY